MSLDQALSTVRQFQSETEALRQVKEPLATRITLYVLVAFVLSGLFLITVTKLDRVVQSQGGKIVPVGQIAVYQALDQSIIKSIDVREGDQVKPGQLLATLDPTFAAADVAQYKAQVASDEAQILRDEAELAGKPFVYDEAKNPDTKNYYMLQKALYNQRIAQYNAQINSFDSKMKQTEATINKLNGDDSRYRQREDIAQTASASSPRHIASFCDAKEWVYNLTIESVFVWIMFPKAYSSSLRDDVGDLHNKGPFQAENSVFPLKCSLWELICQENLEI